MLRQPLRRRIVLIVLFVLALAFTLYVGNKSYVIISFGAANNIPQLSGDGGGGLVFAFVFLVSAVLSLFFQRTGSILYCVATLLVVLTASLYQDNGMFVWAVPPLILAGGNILLYVYKRRAAVALTRNPQNGRSRSRVTSAKKFRA